MKRIAVLTSGGDAPGMNAAIRAVTAQGYHHGVEVIGIQEGFKGIIEGRWMELKPDKTLQKEFAQGGTFLYSARFEEFAQEEVQKEAVERLREEGIEGVVVIGGDGSFKGASALAKLGFPAIAIPATIDNDIPGTEYTIGFDTAVNSVLDNVDKIKDTASSHHRMMVVEVMGRDAGDIALWGGLATGADAIVIPEESYDMQDIADRVRARRESGHDYSLVILAEGIGSADEFMTKYQALDSEADVRAITLGHLQRGGSPTVRDRVYASLFGAAAVDQLLDGKSGVYLGLEQERIIVLDIDEDLKRPRHLKRPDLYQLSIDLTTPFSGNLE